MDRMSNLKQLQKYYTPNSINPFLQNVHAVFAQSNAIGKYKYMKIKKSQFKVYPETVRQQIKYPKSSLDNCSNKKSQSEQFIDKFIRGEKQKLAYKNQSNINQSNHQLLFHINSKSSGISQVQSIPYTSFFHKKKTKQLFNETQRIQSIQNDINKIQEIQTTYSKELESRMSKTLYSFSLPIRQKLQIFKQKLEKYPKKIQKIRQLSKKKQSTVENQQLKKKIKPLIPYNFKQLQSIKSQSYAILQFQTNQLILSYRSKIPLQIASLTKIMTFYLIICIAEKNNINIQKQTIQIKDFVQQITGTSAQLIQGDILTIYQLLIALMLPSGNDAAICLAEWGGKFFTNKKQKKIKINCFISEMNKKAKQLGLQHTRYKNPHGLPNSQSKSSAFDVTKLISVCMKVSVFNQVVNMKSYKTIIKTIYQIDRQIYWQNTNKLLRRQRFLGVKTGITVTAGPCFAGAYNFKNKIYIIVVLRANKLSRRFTDTRKILYWTLNKIYKQRLTTQQIKILSELNKKNRDLDSDNSEDEQEFIYSTKSRRQYAKRKNIIRYEL